MRKLFLIGLGLFVATTLAYADHDIETAGIITDVDNTQKSFTMKTPYDVQMKIQVLPNTEVELDDCGLFGLYDGFGSFKDIKPGIFVEVELFNSAAISTGKGIAKEIKISCKKSAY